MTYDDFIKEVNKLQSQGKRRALSRYLIDNTETGHTLRYMIENKHRMGISLNQLSQEFIIPHFSYPTSPSNQFPS